MALTKLIKKFANGLRKIANNLDKEKERIFCAQLADNCKFTSNAKIYNHSNKNEAMIFKY